MPTRLQAGLSDWLHTLMQYGGQPFQPGGRMDIMHGGIFDPNVPGSLANSGWSILGRPFGATGAEALAQTDKGANYAMGQSTPAPQPFKQPSAPNSFKDSGWAKIDAIGAQRAGVPNLAPMLGAIRMFGERSNNNEVSSAGAKSVYQITPETRQLFLNKYHIDAYASPENAATVGALHLKESIQRGEDPIRGYVGGPDPRKWGPITQAYAGRVGPALGAFESAADATGFGQPPPPLDMSGYKQAAGLLGQVAQNEMKPFSATYTAQETPPLPEPIPYQTPDFTAGDAAFAQAAPKNPFGATPEEQSKNELRMRRADYFAGIGQALANVDLAHGGLGELFLKMGAGALMGARAGNQEVQERQDKFDEEMQRYHLALANRDDSKAQIAMQAANKNIEQQNQHNRDQWTVSVNEMKKYDPRVENGTLISFKKDGDQVTEVHTPIDPTKAASAQMALANVAMRASDAGNEYAQMQYRFNQSLAGAALPYAMSDAMSKGNVQGANDIMALGLQEAVNATVESGQWRQMYQVHFGPERLAQVQQEAYDAAGVQFNPKTGTPAGTVTSDQQQTIQNYISSQMLTDFVNGKKTWALIGGIGENPNWKTPKLMNPDPAVTSSVATQRERDRKVTRTTNAKGQTSVSERY